MDPFNHNSSNNTELLNRHRAEYNSYAQKKPKEDYAFYYIRPPIFAIIPSVIIGFLLGLIIVTIHNSTNYMLLAIIFYSFLIFIASIPLHIFLSESRTQVKLHKEYLTFLQLKLQGQEFKSEKYFSYLPSNGYFFDKNGNLHGPTSSKNTPPRE
jgi:hypothetical protein